MVVLAVSEVVRTRREQAAQRERAEADERQRRVDEERLRLAQDLHDVLAHNISLINVQASVALHLLDDDPEQARPALATIKDVSKDALHELRTALDLLRRGADDEAPRSPTPRLADLDALVAGVRAGGLDVRLEQPATPPTLPAPVESAAYRIVQEALTNVTRHAHARTVTVRLGYDDGVTIEVTDDGRGGPAEPGNGIRGMKERAAALGGTADAGPVPGTGGGFRVTAHLPATISVAGSRSSSPTTRPWSGAGSGPSSTPSRTSPSWARRPTATRRSASPSSTAPTSSSWTSACPASTASPPPAASPPTTGWPT